MFLSKLTLNRSRRTIQWLGKPYRVHQRLCMAAGDDPRLLYRIELPTHAGRGDAYILAQTIERPNWQAAFGSFPVLLGQPDCKPVDYCPSPGQFLAFRLRANPTARRRLEDGSKKRVGLHKEEEQRAWLRRKARTGGFTIVHAVVRQEQPVVALVGSGAKSRRAKLDAVQFDGVMQVTDPELLVKTLAHGIGSAKGFGFGLLSIGPVRG